VCGASQAEAQRMAVQQVGQQLGGAGVDVWRRHLDRTHFAGVLHRSGTYLGSGTGWWHAMFERATVWLQRVTS
jgi:hypothetical protein